VTKTERRQLVAALSLALASAFACAGHSATAAAPGSGDAPGKRPGVECKTVLEIRPGPRGTSGGATPVQKCEPADVPPPTLGGTRSDDEAPRGSPLPAAR
jgi:hypothetical protein